MVDSYSPKGPIPDHSPASQSQPPKESEDTGGQSQRYKSERGRYREMEQLFTKTRQISQRVSDAEQTLLAMNSLAYARLYLGRYKDAELLYDEIVKIAKSDLGEKKPLYCGCNFAAVYGHQGRYQGGRDDLWNC